MQPSRITQWCHHLIQSIASRGGLYIDATMGNGNDTIFLSELAGTDGRVLAFDIQKQALENTKTLLAEKEYGENVEMILDGHENMLLYAKKDSVDVIVFNFGYLPGGDHSLSTKLATSVVALEASLRLLKKGGIMSLCVYSGGDTGFEEKDGILKFLKALPAKDYTVITNEYLNVGNNPPLPVFVFKR